MDPWCWQDDAYKLDSESPLAISQSFWQDLAQTEATSRSLFASTPAPERVQQTFAFGLPTTDAGVLCPESVSGALRGTSRTKRRRMLCFPGSKSEPGCESYYGSGCEGYTVAEDYGASESAWYLRSGPDEDSGGHCCEKWVERCLRNSRDACDQTRNFLDDCAHGQQLLTLYSSSSQAQGHMPQTCCQQDQPDGSSLNEGQDSVEVSQGSYEQPRESCCYDSLQCKEARECGGYDVGDVHKKLGLLPVDSRLTGHKSEEWLSPTVAEAGDGSESETLGPMTPLSTRPSTAGRSRKPNSVTVAAAAVAYPFAVLKPSGAQGDVTLHDINKRISSSPLSGEVRKRKKSSSSSSAVGPPRLSDRAVVALTTIHTEGKGTITIVRTRASSESVA